MTGRGARLGARPLPRELEVSARVRLILALAIATILGGASGAFAALADDPVLTPRAILPMAASDGIYVPPAVQLPPVDPSYCFPANPSGAPPTRIFGTLTIGGQPASVNTIVQVTFDGVAGPAAATQAPGGYHIDYNAGGASCSNHVGAAIAIAVNGTPVATGTAVGDSSEPFLIFNIALP